MATIAGGEEKKINREVLEVRNEEKEQRTQLAEELESFILNKEHPEKTFSMNAGWRLSRRKQSKS